MTPHHKKLAAYLLFSTTTRVLDRVIHPNSTFYGFRASKFFAIHKVLYQNERKIRTEKDSTFIFIQYLLTKQGILGTFYYKNGAF